MVIELKKGFVFFVVIFFLGGVLLARPVQSSSRIFYSWEMAEGFGLDRNYDGRIDIPNTVLYAKQKKFDVFVRLEDSFFVAHSQFSKKDQLALFISLKGRSEKGENVSVQLSGKGTELTVPKLACGNYEGTLKVQYKNKKKAIIPISLSPKRILIASLGDSYSSGEGCPERLYSPNCLSIWGDGGPGSLAGIDHLVGHRSAIAWPAQTAIFLEREDPHSSVIFLFLAASGAKIDYGFIDSFDGVDHSLGRHLPPQLDELALLTAGEKIDYLLLGIGGNDLGLVPTTMLGLLYDPGVGKAKSNGYLEKIPVLLEAIRWGDWSQCHGGKIMGFDSQPPLLGALGVSDGYRMLDNVIKERFTVENILLVGYPSMLFPGITCFDDLVAGCEVDAYEATLLYDNIILPFTRMQEEVAKKLGWQFISVMEEYDMSLHHYGAPDPYDPSVYEENLKNLPISWHDFKNIHCKENKRWFRNLKESIAIQGGVSNGGLPWLATTKGILHPNELGYQAVMHQVLKRIKLPKDFPSDFQKEYQK